MMIWFPLTLPPHSYILSEQTQPQLHSHSSSCTLSDTALSKTIQIASTISSHHLSMRNTSMASVSLQSLHCLPSSDKNSQGTNSYRTSSQQQNPSSIPSGTNRKTNRMTGRLQNVSKRFGPMLISPILFAHRTRFLLSMSSL